MSVQFLKTDPEVRGSTLAYAVGAFTSRTLMRLRAQYGLARIERDEWYPAYNVMALLRDLGRTPDGPFTLVSMGITLASKVELSEHVRDIPAGLLQLCESLFKSWRGGSPGELAVELLGTSRVRFVVKESQLPPDFVYGMVYGMVHRVGPKDIEAKIERFIHGTTLSFDIGWEIVTAPFR